MRIFSIILSLNREFSIKSFVTKFRNECNFDFLTGFYIISNL